ncbi:hypothetical protein LEP1GSC188_0811 [Leptospira weilii serovar Topaz str. LT2116]|uniref:Kua-ubiquitin conjugating enzyme hybrid localization domain protein n=1 Tax=Leptospira weilii serovar Topaz str. LT2116 TaxID=1088540 RepID=M3ELM2_9LEPT|nr:hypothetical protein LEP1GSC188_0811 [Leptospira weilii serovar Topaz str. LT2116]
MQSEPTQLQKPDLTIHRIFETLSVVAFVFLSIYLGYQLTRIFSNAFVSHFYLVWVVPLVVLFSWLGADFISGLVHFLGDSVGSEKTPILGPAFIFLLEIITWIRRESRDMIL